MTRWVTRSGLCRATLIATYPPIDWPTSATGSVKLLIVQLTRSSKDLTPLDSRIAS